MKVFVVMSYNIRNPFGDDVEVLGIFSTLENAEAAKELREPLSWEEIEIIEYTLDSTEFINY